MGFEVRKRLRERVDERNETVKRHQEHDRLAGNIRGRVGTGAFPAGARADEDLVGDSSMRRRHAGEQRGAER